MNKAKVILDTKGLVMHSYFRCKDNDSTIFNEKGERVTRATSAFETFLTTYLRDIFAENAPKDVIAVWEGGNERRRDLFEGYKLKRSQKEKDPVEGAELKELYKLVKSFLAGIGAVQVTVPTVEADDVIAYLCKNIEPYCVIHTVDHDLIQLSSPTCLLMVKEEPVTEMTVKQAPKPEYTVPANLVVLYKSLVGDTSDEYPGVSGFGHVAWLNTVAAFGIDGMEELDAIARSQDFKALEEAAEGDKALTKVLDQKYRWVLMYELAKLHPSWCQGEFKGKLVKPEWFKRIPDTARVARVLEKSGCLDLLPELEKYLPSQHLITADNVDDLLYSGDLLDTLNDSVVAFDYEGFDKNKFESLQEVKKGFVDVLSQRVVGASFTFGPNLNKTIYISVGHKDTNNANKSVISDMLGAIDTKNLVVQNQQYEFTVTQKEFGKEFAEENVGACIDTAVMSSYVDENEPSGLKSNAKQWLNYTQTTYKEGIGDRSGMEELTAEETFDYGCDDAIVTAHLWSLWDLIMQVEGTKKFCYAHEFLTTKVFTDAFIKGCPVALDRLEKMAIKDKRELENLWPKLRKLLAENCSERNEEAASAYVEEIRDFEIARHQHAEKTEEFIANKLESISQEFKAGSAYSPYEEATVPHEFKPTKTQFNEALIRLDLPAEIELEGETIPSPYHLASVAVSRITAWAVTLKEYLELREQESVDTFGTEEYLPPLSAQLDEFVGLVAAAAHQFKKREGEAYEKLEKFMGVLFADKAKVVATGDELNLDSPKQMAQLLYGKLALPIRHRSKVTDGSTRQLLHFAGGPATNDKAIEIALAEDAIEEGGWIREVLMTVRSIKSLSTKFKFYYNPYPLWTRPDDGRIHPSIKNCGTVTRRPTGGSPNILQVAKGPIRSSYVPMEEGHVFIAPDFSGQELRLLGSESGDPALLEAYIGETRKDIHSLTATAILPNICKKTKPELFGDIFFVSGGKAQDYDQFVAWKNGEAGEEKEKFANWVRNKRAKACNFLKNYGGGASTLSTNILVPEKDAQQFLDDMDALYTGITPFQEEQARLGRTQGYVTTAYGNRRHMPDGIIDKKDKGKRLRVERQAGNFVIQGGAADILKVVISACESTGLLKEYGAYILAPVYDEVVCSVPAKHVVPFSQKLQKLMDVTPPGHVIPMVSEFSIGYDWYNMMETGVDTSEETLLKALEKAKEMQEDFDEKLKEDAADIAEEPSKPVQQQKDEPKEASTKKEVPEEPSEELLAEAETMVTQAEEGWFSVATPSGTHLANYMKKHLAINLAVKMLRSRNKVASDD